MKWVDLSKYETDKSERYLENYRNAFSSLFDQKISLLELGVHRGGSLLLWHDLFPYATLAGLDIEPALVRDGNGRIKIYQGSQDDVALLDRIAQQSAPDGFDIIIDDASHIADYASISFWHLFMNHLRPGGIYVIEDWGTGYWPSWPRWQQP